MTIPSLITAAAEAAASESDISPWVVGAVVFSVLAALLLTLLAFGAGRDHS